MAGVMVAVSIVNGDYTSANSGGGSPTPVDDFILQENGDPILQENGDEILQE